MIGETVSHFRIIELLGNGGMGVVYRAEDLRLNRPVALKFLPPELSRDQDAKQRFVSEAAALSSLQHKNICVVHDIDETDDGRLFITMEFLEGDTLRKMVESGPLPIEQAVHIALEVAHGLASAHKHGTVHRDIKPANIILTRDQTVKILDFGVAGIIGREAHSADSMLAGTVAYMSPEQTRAEQVDQRADIWSLGVVLYEMVTGQRPFGGEYHQATLYAISNEKQKPVSILRPDVPQALENIIDRCLEKSPDARYQNMESFAVDLQQLTTPAQRKEAADKSIAVLPFQDLSPEKDNAYFTEGLSEEIVAKLSRLRNLKILPLHSVISYDRTGKSVKQIAGDLRVEYLLQGSVRRHGPNLRVTTQLIMAEQDAVLWAETKDGTMDEVFDIQEHVANRVVHAMKLRLTPHERKTLQRRATRDTEAFQLYLRGRFFWNKRRKESFWTAIRYFEQAIEKDPGYAPAWAGIADSYNLLTEYAGTERTELFARGKASARKALEFDPRLAEAHASLGLSLMLTEYDWKGAEKAYKAAIRYNPNYSTGHHWYGEWLCFQGRHTEAIAEMTKAEKLDPLSPIILNDKGMILYYGRDYDGAIDSARIAQELDAEFVGAHRLLSLAYTAKGMFSEAAEEHRRWSDSGGGGVDALIALAYCHAASGKRQEAEEILRQTAGHVSPTGNWYRGVALVHAALGNIDGAFPWLEKALELKAESLCMMKVDPKLDPLRGDARFDSFLARTGLKP